MDNYNSENNLDFCAEIAYQSGGSYKTDNYDSFENFIFGVRDGFDGYADFAVRLSILEEKSPWIKVRKSDLYVLSLNYHDYKINDKNWQNIPENLINYPGEIKSGLSVKLIKKAFENATS